MTALPISIFLIARNEADRIGDVIRAVRDLSDDIVVVDSGSTDGTQSVAEALGARVIFNPWTGFGPQKRFAEEQCRYDWLINLDADEVVPPKLKAEIRQVYGSGRPAYDAFKIGIAEIFPGEGEPHPWSYTTWRIRLYRRDKGRFSSSVVHDHVELAPGARVCALRNVIHHASIRSLGHQIEKLNRYSDQQAYDLAVRGQSIATWRVFLEFGGAFVKAYVGRRHFVRGVYGFLTAMNYAFSRHLRAAKDYERRRAAGWGKGSSQPREEPVERS